MNDHPNDDNLDEPPTVSPGLTRLVVISSIIVWTMICICILIWVLRIYRLSH